MAFDFPASPANGAVYTLNGISYVWNGYAWMQAGIAPTTDNERGRVKAWIKALYTTGVPAMQASFNLSSLTDTNVGQMACNISSPFVNANYAAVSAARLAGNYTGSFPYFDNNTAAYCNINFYACPGVTATGPTDPSHGAAQFIGDLA